VPGETPCTVTAQHVGVHAGRTYVVITDDDVKRNAANEGSAGLIGVHVAVPDGEPVVAIAAFRAIVINVVAGVEREVRLGELGHAGNFEVMDVVHQVGDAGLEIGDPQRT